MKWGDEQQKMVGNLLFNQDGSPRVDLLENVFKIGLYAFIGKTLIDLFSDLFRR